MRNSIFVLATAALLAVPTLASAQGWGIAGRAGTLGVGAEGAVALGGSIVLRGGFGLMPFEPSVTIDDLEVTLKLPKQWYNVGLDLYIGGGLRIGGGMLFKSEDPSLTGTFTTSQDIGGRDFTPGELGTLTGVLDSEDQAPYALIGFGKHTSSGIGLFLDLGAAFVGDPNITLAASGGTFSDQGELTSRLAAEATSLEDSAGTYLKIWPIINIGIKIGVGN